MKKTLLSVFVLLCTITYAQKKVVCTKKSIEVDGIPIADYKGKGGIFSDRKFFIFAPGTKDTLFKILQTNTDLNNPMVDQNLMYTVYFNNPEKSEMSFVNPKGWGYVGEKKFLSILFNDDMPLIIDSGKLSATGIKAFIEKNNFDFEAIKKNVKQVNDSILAMKNLVIDRDKTKPVDFIALNNDILPKFYLCETHPAYKLFEIRQNGVLIGIMEKETRGGEFAKGAYVFYKAVKAFKVGGYNIEYLPVSFSETSPSVTSSSTVKAISVKLFGGLGASYDSPANAFNAAESTIVQTLISRGLL
jgi:hypothetical protein